MSLFVLSSEAQALAEQLIETPSIELVKSIHASAISAPFSAKPVTTTYVHSDDFSNKALGRGLDRGDLANGNVNNRSTPQGGQRDNQDQPIVLLHGFDSSVMEFRRLFSLLAPTRETWAIDLFGFGFTDRPAAVEFSAVNIKQHLYSTWRTLINRPITLVGASMGGAAAIDFCLTYPDVVKNLVLIDSAGLTKAPDMGKFMVPPLGWLAAEFLRNRRVRQNISRAAYYNKTLASPDALACSMLHVTHPDWRRAMISFTRSGGYTFLSQPIVENITCPTLILWGRNDEILGTKEAEGFNQAIADSKLVWCDRCGHVPHLEKPEEVAQHILDFGF